MTRQNVYRQHLDIRSHSPFHSPIFTDGLNVGNGVTAAMVTGQQHYGIRIPKRCSIFIAEVLLALEYIEKTQQNNFIIFTDSK